MMNKLLDSICSSMSAETEAAARDMDSDDHHVLMAHKIPLEMYAFLVNWISSAAEAVKTPGEGDVATSKPKARVPLPLSRSLRPLTSLQRGRAPKTAGSVRGTKKKG